MVYSDRKIIEERMPKPMRNQVVRIILNKPDKERASKQDAVDAERVKGKSV